MGGVRESVGRGSETDWLAAGVLASVLAFAGAIAWSGFTFLVGFVLGPVPTTVVAAVLTAIPLLTTGYVALAAEEGPTLELAGYVVLAVGATISFLAIVGVTALLALAAPLGVETAATVAGAATFVLATASCLGAPVAVRLSSSTSTRALTLRMVVATLVLVLATLWLVLFVWLLAFLAAVFVVGPTVGVYVAGAVALALAAWIAAREYRQVADVEARIDATPTTAAARPDLHATTARIAAQLDVPMPTIAVSETDTPEAMVIGFRSSSTHLVLSMGTVSALSAAELEAVISHELAHVANRDAMVMTVLSVPVVLADSFRLWLWRRTVDPERTVEDEPERTVTLDDGTEVDLIGDEDEWASEPVQYRTGDDEPEESNSLGVGIYAMMTLSWVVSRSIVAVLSRTRELAADRTAAEVTGSPAALAEALRTLDERIEATPDRDLRQVASVSSLSILPLDPMETDPDYDLPYDWSLVETLHRLRVRLFRSHPPTETRLDRLRTITRDRE